jgi:hypothetical protein
MKVVGCRNQKILGGKFGIGGTGGACLLDDVCRGPYRDYTCISTSQAEFMPTLATLMLA